MGLHSCSCTRVRFQGGGPVTAMDLDGLVRINFNISFVNNDDELTIMWGCSQQINLLAISCRRA